MTSANKHRTLALISLPCLVLAAFYAAQLAQASEANPDRLEADCQRNSRADLGDDLEIGVHLDNQFEFEELLREQIDNILSGEKETISRESKRPFPAEVIFKTDEGACATRGEVSLSGDWPDHLGLQSLNDLGVGTPSLDVEIEGGFRGFTNFKLFTEGTRDFESEILGQLILSELGILSPANQVVQVNFLGVSYTALLQDKIASNLLELQRRPGGPIFEIDERLIWGDYGGEKFYQPHFVRLVNKDYARQNGSSGLYISALAHDRLQKLLLDKQKHGWNFRTLDFDELASESRWFRTGTIDKTRFADFYVLLSAMRGEHGLAVHNRSFYFNPIVDHFEPIYYDGNLNFHKPWTLAELEEPNLFAPFRHALKPDVEVILENLADIERTVIRSFSERQDVQKRLGEKSVSFARGAFGSIEGFLTTLQASDNEIPLAEDFVPNFWPTQETNFERIFLNVDSASFRSNQISGSVCTSPEKCTDRVFRRSDLDDLYANRLSDAWVLTVSAVEPEDPVALDERSGFFTIGNVATLFDPERQHLSAVLLGEDSRLVVYGSFLDGFEIDVKSSGHVMRSQPREHEFNRYGMTGCVEIINSVLQNVSLRLSGSFCEDGIHISNSVGSNVQLDVEYALADAIDIDRSEVDFSHIKVRHSVNDCFDVSETMSTIREIKADGCGDKILSAGERSVVNILDVEGSGGYGIVAKDEAIVRVNHARLSTTYECVSEYQKKWIFGSGSADVESLECG